jgi:ribosome maturation factor RimP
LCSATSIPTHAELGLVPGNPDWRFRVAIHRRFLHKFIDRRSGTPPVPIEFPGISPYSKDADEFVRLSCRGFAGWRRDEWAHSPLFIWRKLLAKFAAVWTVFRPPSRVKSREASGGKPLVLRHLVTMAVRLDEIRRAAQRVAASHGLDVVDLEFTGSAKERILRVFLEKNAEGRARLRAEIAAGAEGLPERLVEGTLSPEQLSGVTHEDCAEFSRDFGVLLDVEELVPGSEYTLEASSPGLDRKLTRAEDFRRFTGSLVKIQTFEPIRNNRHWQGRLVDTQVSESRPTTPSSEAHSGTVEPSITIDLAAVKQNSKSRKAGVSTVEIALSNIEKAQLVPEI